MELMKIRINLARDREHPGGSTDRGYEIIAPLTAEDRLDPEAWRDARDQCHVRRFWAGEDDEIGHLVRTRGGHWAFHYDLSEDIEDDEVGYRFSDHVFRAGEYVSVREHDGEMRTFRVVLVQPLSSA